MMGFRRLDIGFVTNRPDYGIRARHNDAGTGQAAQPRTLPHSPTSSELRASDRDAGPAVTRHPSTAPALSQEHAHFSPTTDKRRRPREG